MERIMQKQKIETNEITLRIAKIEDADEILKIYSYYVKNTAISFEWDVPSLQDFSERIENTLKKYPYIVAEINQNNQKKIIGYAYAGDFKTRAAYDWSVETSIYVDKDFRHCGVGKLLLKKLEQLLQKQNILNVNACIAFAEEENEYLTNDSYRFHQKMGYKLVGTFHKCGYKFDKWFDMIWMEKIIGKHIKNQPKVLDFNCGL